MTVYRIRNWDEFENSRSREVKTLTYIGIPNKHDGEGYSILMTEHEDGALHYAAWILMLQVASKCEPRGTLCRSDGTPLDARALGLKTRAPKEIFSAAIPRLIDIGWLEAVEQPQEEAAPPQKSARKRRPAADVLPTSCRHAADGPPILGDDIGEEDRGGEKRRIKTPHSPPPAIEPNGVGTAAPEPPSASPKTPAAADPRDVALYGRCVGAWNAERKARGLNHWPTATVSRDTLYGDLRARVRLLGGPEPFWSAFEERLRRAAAGYAEPIEGSAWRPSLPWLLTANGWRKASAYADPGPIPDPDADLDPRIRADIERYRDADPPPPESDAPLSPEKRAEYEAKLEAIKREAADRKRQEAEERRIIEEWKNSPPPRSESA